MSDFDGMSQAGGARSRLCVYNPAFLTRPYLRRILTLAGYDLRIGVPSPSDRVGIWGNSSGGERSKSIAARYDTPLLTIQEGFLGAALPGRLSRKDPPLGLLLDRSGPHFDPAQPSDLETLLANAPLDDSHLLRRGRDCIERLQDLHLSKFNGFAPESPVPDPGYVLVLDQIRDDASVLASVPNAASARGRFREMLVFAQQEHPGARVLIKPHPETIEGLRPGYFSAKDATGRVELLTTHASPWALMEGAVAVYTVSSQLGFEAILAGHKPRVFGQPFYAGWGLSQDEFPLARRQRRLTRAQLFAGAMMLYPLWYDPFRDRLCELDRAIDILEAKIRAWRQDRAGWAASEMRLWKRAPLQQAFGQQKRMVFTDDPKQARESGRNWMVWAGKATERHIGAHRVEDGFLRSRGLGSELVPPLSLVVDRQGIYYDPTQRNDLEDWIEARSRLTPSQEQRAERLVQRLLRDSLSKYNLGGAVLDLPPGHRILVPGQVEDDASIRLGAGKVRTNLDLLRSVRRANPDAVIIYKPHPDVEAGLRKGQIVPEDLADVVAHNSDPMALLDQVKEVWTITSLMGFEALLRGVKVTTLGVPFYANWGLTNDLGPVPTARKARPGLLGLTHAVLIDYPRYFDPETGLPCPVEVVLDRLAADSPHRRGLVNRSLSQLQRLFASYAHWWRG